MENTSRKAEVVEIARSIDEINEVVAWAMEGLALPMTQGVESPYDEYQQGIVNMWEWLVGNSDDRPDQQ